jgi:hypothetical protein
MPCVNLRVVPEHHDTMSQARSYLYVGYDITLDVRGLSRKDTVYYTILHLCTVSSPVQWAVV